MHRSSIHVLFAASLVASILVTGCNRRDTSEAAAEPAATADAPPIATEPGVLAPVETEAPAADAGITISNVELGSAIGADNRVTTAMTTFSPRDTVYVVVAADNATQGGELGARWTFQDGQVVDTNTKTLTSTGPAMHEFHVGKPDGWPVGRYRVDILTNGTVAQTREFEVR